MVICASRKAVLTMGANSRLRAISGPWPHILPWTSGRAWKGDPCTALSAVHHWRSRPELFLRDRIGESKSHRVADGLSNLTAVRGELRATA